MGAAATLEAIMCLLASREGVVPHTVGLEEHDPECELDFVVTAPRAVSPAGEPPPRSVSAGAMPRSSSRGMRGDRHEVAAVGVVTGWGEGAAALPSDAVRAAAGRRVIAAARPPLSGERFRRATRECLPRRRAVEALLREANIEREEIRGCETALVT